MKAQVAQPGDSARLASCADDTVFTSPHADRGGAGQWRRDVRKEALRHHWTGALRNNLGLHFELLGVYFGVDALVIQLRIQQGAAWCEVLAFSGGLVRAGHGTHAADG